MLAVGGCTGAALAGPGSHAQPRPHAAAGPPRAAAAPSITARVLTTSRRNALRAGYVRVRVGSRRSAGVHLFAVARSAGGGSYSVTRRRLIRLRARGARTVRLGLNRAGRRILGGCRELTLRAGGRARGRARSQRSLAPAQRLRAPRRAMRRDLPSCGKTAPSGPAGGAGRSGGSAGAGNGSGGAGPEDISAPPGGPPLGELNTASSDRCDFLDPSLCLYPFPNDHFTAADTQTETGRRLNLNLQSMPQNRAEKPIDPTDQNRADGFSPGNMIITRVPGLESQAAFDETGAVPITDMARTYDADQPVVVINARTGQRQLIWAEVDANPADPEDVTLIIRPGENFDEGERYIVALRRMRDSSGAILEPREEFRAYRDFATTDNPDIEAGRARYERIFSELGAAGIARRDLYMAWDFTVAGRESLSGRAVNMRDDAFAQLGDTNLADREVQGSSPVFVQNADIDDSIGGEPGELDGYREFASGNTARRITGTIAVPCYLDMGCAPGGGFVLGEPMRTGVTQANVICTVPRSALGNAAQSRPSLYGHGLLGSAGEVTGGSAQPFGNAANITFCATDWAGMSTLDAPNVVSLLQDLSKFNTLVDRIQQGYVNFMYLGRWMIHPGGASTNPGFQTGTGASLLDTRRLFYDGNSQGGILSGGLTALTPDFDRSVHGVPGMNYSTLLRRSVDFDTYAHGDFEGVETDLGLYDNYPDELERPLILSLIQLLWDRGESNGYAQHMTDDPLPNSPSHQVLLHPAFGDHQVANVSAEVEARSIGASAYRPALYAGRSPDVEPLFGIPTAPVGFTGSAIVYWDGGPPGRPVNGEERGTPAPPTENVPPRDWQGSPQLSALRPQVLGPEVRLPEHRRHAHQPVRPRSLLRGRLHGTLRREPHE